MEASRRRTAARQAASRPRPPGPLAQRGPAAGHDRQRAPDLRGLPPFRARAARPYPEPARRQVALPEWARLGGWLAGGLNWHFALAWPFVITGLVYLGFLALLGRVAVAALPPARRRARRSRCSSTTSGSEPTHPPQGKHNALQKGAYTFIVLLGALAALSGFAIYKPVQLAWLTALFGGYELARYWHFWAVWIFVGFTAAARGAGVPGGPGVAARDDHGLVPREVSEPWLSATGTDPPGLPAAGRWWRRPSLVAACGWDGGPLLEPRLRAISRLNDWVGEKILLSPTRLAPQYPVRGADRLTAAFPAYSITRNRTGAFPAPPATGLGARRSAGWCGRRSRLTRAMLEALPARDLHGEAPLRRGVDRDRHLDRRAGVRRGGDGAADGRTRAISGSTRSTADTPTGGT